jgi:hypothetical protein
MAELFNDATSSFLGELRYSRLFQMPDPENERKIQNVERNIQD